MTNLFYKLLFDGGFSLEDGLSDFLKSRRQPFELLLLIDLNLCQLFLSSEQYRLVALGTLPDICLSELHGLPDLHCSPIVAKNKVMSGVIHDIF